MNLFSVNATSPATTDLLYSGEQFDPNLQQQYLRARYYDQNNGTFNRLDPYSGNNHDPQSLHKYAYCHSDPINNVDYLGLAIYSIIDLTATSAIWIGLSAGILSSIAGVLRSDTNLPWYARMGIGFLSGFIGGYVGAYLAVTFPALGPFWIGFVSSGLMNTLDNILTIMNDDKIRNQLNKEELIYLTISVFFEAFLGGVSAGIFSKVTFLKPPTGATAKPFRINTFGTRRGWQLTYSKFRNKTLKWSILNGSPTSQLGIATEVLIGLFGSTLYSAIHSVSSFFGKDAAAYFPPPAEAFDY